MLALLETQITPPERWYERLPWRGRSGCAIRGSECPRYLHTVLELPVNTDGDQRRLRAGRAGRELAQRGVTSVVLPQNFSWTDDTLSGLTICSPLPLYRRLGWRAVAREIQRKERGLTVALLARHPSSLLTEAVRGLKTRVKTLAVWAGSETEAFCYGLRKYEGLARLAQESPVADIYLLLEPPSAELRVADRALVLDFSGAPAGVRGGVIADALELSPPSEWENRWPWGCDTPAFLQALYADGQIGLSSIRVGQLLRQGKPVEW